MNNLKHPPIDYVKIPLFKRVFQTVILVLLNPVNFFKNYTMESTPWSAYLFATTYTGLITVIAHGIYLLRYDTSLVWTKFLLILMLDYFSVLVIVPLFLMLITFLIRLINNIIGNNLTKNNKYEFKVVLNIFFFSTVYYPLVLIPYVGEYLFLIVLFTISYVGMVVKKYDSTKTFYNISTFLIVSLISLFLILNY